MNESASKESAVPARAKPDWSESSSAGAWLDRSIWSERMLAALDNGVKGGKWFSLIDDDYGRSCASRKKKRPGAGRCHADQRRWPNATSLLPVFSP